MRIVSKILMTIGIAVMLLSAIKCHRDPVEEDLRISTTASMNVTTTSPYFDFDLRIESAVPPNGVVIEINVKGESDNHVYFQQTTGSTRTNTRLYISNLPRQIMCICTIVVTSKTKNNNTAAASFRIGYK